MFNQGPFYPGWNYVEIESKREKIPAKIHCGLGYSGAGKSNGQPASVVYSNDREILISIQRGKSKVYVVHSLEGEASLHQVQEFRLGRHSLFEVGNPIDHYRDRIKALPEGERVSLKVNGTLIAKLED